MRLLWGWVMSKQELGPNQRKWVEALRSGDYQQGRFDLRTSDNCYCCLGVACNLFTQGEWVLAPHGEYFTINEFCNTADHDAVAALALRGAAGNGLSGIALYQMNDQGQTFAQIANAIESDPANWFTEAR